jgi:hypothetical protein
MSFIDAKAFCTLVGSNRGDKGANPPSAAVASALRLVPPPGVSFTDSTARKNVPAAVADGCMRSRGGGSEIDDKRDVRVWESMERSRPVPVTYRRRYVAGAACCGHRGRSPAWTAHPTCC